MGKSVSSTALIDNDQLDVWNSGDLEWCHQQLRNPDSEESLSGYKSSPECHGCVTDVQSSSFDNKQHSDKFSDEEIEIMNYRSTDALCNNLKYILEMPELCDVKFLVGPRKVSIYGVQAIMGTRSRSFYNLILKTKRDAQEKDKKIYCKTFQRHINRNLLTIEVKKYEPDVFRKIVQFVHCGSVDVKTENVAGLLCGASQFGLRDLEEACWDYVERCLQCDYYITIVHSANRNIHHKVAVQLLSKIDDHLECARKRQFYTPIQETAV